MRTDFLQSITIAQLGLENKLYVVKTAIGPNP
jgi:hypothetical protein